MNKFVVMIALAYGALVAPVLATEAEVVTLAAFDVGSGGIKVTVADVDRKTHAIAKIHFAFERLVPLKRDMQISGQPRFSEAIQQQAIEALATFKRDVAKYQPVEWCGIATMASRQAQNAAEFYAKVRDELGINISVVSQEEEGRVGFLTAGAVGGVPQQNLIAYDSGSASFQITTLLDGRLEVVGGKFGLIPAHVALVTNIRGESMDHRNAINPISVDEARQVVAILQQSLPEMSDAFRKKLADSQSQVVGIGTKNSIYALAAEVIGDKTFTKEQLWHGIETHCNLSNAQMSHLSDPHETVISMILLYSVMDGLGIDKVTYGYANGSCEGILADPTFWTATR